jgi:GNAT superfamily N-acetyltransferase
VRYVAAVTSHGQRDATKLHLMVGDDREVIWIRDLRVAEALRGRGLGRQLVRAVERVARELGVSQVMLLPLSQAADFWRKLGYRPAPDMSRVLTKWLGAADHA